MVRAVLHESSASIFTNGAKPQLLYLYREGDGKMKASYTLQLQNDTAELIIIEKGCGRYMIDSQPYNIVEKNILLINAGTLHGLCPEDSPSIQCCRLGIQNLQLKGLPTGKVIKDGILPILSCDEHFDILHGFLELYEKILCHSSQNNHLQEAQDNLLAAMLICIMQDVKNTHQTTSHIQEYNLGLHIKEYIDNHYLEDLHLNDIAAALHINPYYMSHTFKKAIGYSPIQYMIRRRIGESQNLLMNTRYTITDIALRCGYNNSNYFQADFNSIVGMPPGRYRKSCRKCQQGPNNNFAQKAIF